jgi:hypothetical protein
MSDGSGTAPKDGPDSPDPGRPHGGQEPFEPPPAEDALDWIELDDVRGEEPGPEDR